MEAMKEKSEKEWVPAGLENPSPRSTVPWTVLAERRRRRTETVARCYMRFSPRSICPVWRNGDSSSSPEYNAYSG
jgi:hypothetical protein